jgi:putative DNA primase/helicase
MSRDQARAERARQNEIENARIIAAREQAEREQAGPGGADDPFADLPDEMREAVRWLVWKSVPAADPTKKPRKVPCYADGGLRGETDTEADRARLAPFVAALAALQSGNYTGLGFALGPDGTGQVWQGIDLDDMPNRPHLHDLADELPGYTEASPSGKGVHAIGYGRLFASLGSNESGIEAYARGRFFTVTAEQAGIHPPVCLADFVETRLRPMHSPGKPGTGNGPDRAYEGGEDLTPLQQADLRSALLSLRADDRDLWIRMGQALKTAGDIGRGLWLNWSQTSEKFDPADAARVWESFKPTGTGWRAVLAEAQRNGWANPGKGEPGANWTFAEKGTAGDPDSPDWPEPQPLGAKIEPEPYPLDALPDTIRAAVQEVAEFVKAPVAMVASSALAALSLAGQAHVDVKRADKLHGPSGLFLLTIADSGERKSTCDGFFTSAIREYQEQQAELAKPAIERHKADMDAWNAERDGILQSIKGAVKGSKTTDKLRADLANLQVDKPEAPKVPRLIYADATPEALAHGLAHQWPSGGVVSAEAGVVFGSHAMGKDSVMRNLALLNQLWDGTSLTIDRRTSESFTVHGARLTVALQVQEPTLREFFRQSGALARGTGFLARFLVAWPESTQGQRLFSEAPANWPHLAAFHRRVESILANPVPVANDGTLCPALLSLTPAAKTAWVEYHDAIEAELASGGELYDVRDVASKSADNAARMAALFHLFGHGVGGAAGPDSFESASRVAAWHLHEARRFFGELALPPELADAARLDTWLIGHCKRERTHMVGKRSARQFGPVREGARLDSAIRELCELDRVRLVKDGKRLTIHVNPALVGVAI